MLSLLRLACKQKNSSNLFRIRIFLLLSYSFGIETINTFIHSRSSLENHILDSRPNWAKCIPIFRPKRRKKPPRWGGTYLCSLYKRVPPTGRGGGALNTFLIPEIFMFLATEYCIHGRHTRYCNNTAFHQG